MLIFLSESIRLEISTLAMTMLRVNVLPVSRL